MTTSLTPTAFELQHAVDAAAVDELRAHIRSITIAPRRLDLECGGVFSIDPVGAALLWLLCTELERSVGTHIRLVHLPLPVAHRLRNHPLGLYILYGDDMFHDPFHSAAASNR